MFGAESGECREPTVPGHEFEFVARLENSKCKCLIKVNFKTLIFRRSLEKKDYC